jgi:ATP-dependent Clp protease ATP-binding subunit ClpA
MHAAKGEEVSQLLNLEKTIHGKFIDQEEAVKAVADALREYRAGVTRKGGPIASFLFCGPTGVGKTELSKILAETQFGDKNAMVRFDMTEYQDKQSFYRLIGSPDGVMRGVLTDAVLEKPYSLILLDEFEKAYPDILNLFLQVLDDGRLTDNLGRTVDFSNTIIIATSNAHSTLIKEELGKGTAILAITDVLKKRLTEYFKPELINRFSQVVVFKSLSQEDIVAVARLNLADLSATLSESQAVELKYDESAVLEIAKRGFDPIFGARPLRQAINENLRSKLADQLLREQIKKGDRITVFYRDGNFVFEK